MPDTKKRLINLEDSLSRSPVSITLPIVGKCYTKKRGPSKAAGHSGQGTERPRTFGLLDR